MSVACKAYHVIQTGSSFYYFSILIGVCQHRNLFSVSNSRTANGLHLRDRRRMEDFTLWTTDDFVRSSLLTFFSDHFRAKAKDVNPSFSLHFPLHLHYFPPFYPFSPLFKGTSNQGCGPSAAKTTAKGSKRGIFFSFSFFPSYLLV